MEYVFALGLFELHSLQRVGLHCMPCSERLITGCDPLETMRCEMLCMFSADVDVDLISDRA